VLCEAKSKESANKTGTSLHCKAILFHSFCFFHTSVERLQRQKGTLKRDLIVLQGPSFEISIQALSNNTTLNPVHCTTLNPVHCTTLNPVHCTTLNPVLYTYTSVEQLLNP